ncbi:MAG: Nif11 family protein [Eggerthellaceae bacterium]|nr:Nif11 family protein [Eggerthellaceae bacterium]
MNLEDLSPEQQEKIRSCKTLEELVELVEKEGYELSNETLEAIAGGLKIINDYAHSCFPLIAG